MGITTILEKIISSYRTSIVLMFVWALWLAVATFVEHFVSTEVAKIFLYYSPISFLILFFLVINFIVVSSNHNLFTKKKIAFIVIHIAIIIILMGALTSHIFGEEGSLHLREYQPTNQMQVTNSNGNHAVSLPFSIELQEFELTRYPGSSSPSSFESTVKLMLNGEERIEKISMNNVLDIEGYRLFQASYDLDEKGSILSVNKDVAGRNITYLGYLLLIIGFSLSFIGKNTRFQQLAKELKSIKNLSLLILLFISCPLFSNETKTSTDMFQVIQKHKIAKDHAKLFGALPMQGTNGRMKPVNTFSSEVLRKLHHSNKIGNLNSDQFLISVLTLPEMWQRVPFIYSKNKDIAFRYDISENYCAYYELFDTNGFYKLEEDVALAHQKSPATRNKFDKDLIKLDEQINIFNQLINYRLLNIFPNENDATHKWYASGDNLSALTSQDSIYIANMMPQYTKSVLNTINTGNWSKANEIVGIIQEYQITKNTGLELSNAKLQAEIHSNNLDAFRYCKILYLILGGILLVLTFAYQSVKNKLFRTIITLLTVAIGATLLLHLAGLVLRGYIAGYAPWSNAYETMVYVAFITVIGGFAFIKHSRITFALATLFAGIILFVSGLNWMDPQINSLVPVLKSPWLMIHVAVIVAAYSFFGISCLLGLTNVSMLFAQKVKNNDKRTNRIKELSIINEMSLLIGLALMTIGTFLGAIWANESWGRYWGWDSKETWALITVLVYAIVVHLRLVKKWDNPRLFNLMTILAFLAVLMTYFGVNYFLTGLHSYA